MAGLTVTEKEHWKDRIGKRIAKRIETISARDPDLLTRMQRDAERLACQSLGLAALQDELAAIKKQEDELERRESGIHQAMLAVIRRVPVEEVEDARGYGPHQDVTAAIQKRRAVNEEELLARDPLGREILRLRQEKDNLLDTVWLATSPAELKQLWAKVTELLGDDQTQLQKDALDGLAVPAQHVVTVGDATHA
jgi:hypothetical protein